MDFNPAYMLQPSVAFAWRPIRAKIAAFACATLILLPLLNDVFRESINLSILFFLPVLFCAWMGERRLLRPVTGVCVALTYLGFAARMQLHPPEPRYLWHWGLANRTFVAISLISITVLLDLVLQQLQVRSYWRAIRCDADQNVYEEVIFSAQRFAAVMLAVGLSLIVFIVDIITPQQLNFPILYTIPLLLTVWTRSHLWLWLMLSWLIVLAAIGWFVGQAPTIPSDFLSILATNRLIAAVVLFLLALIIHSATSPQIPSANSGELFDSVRG